MQVQPESDDLGFCLSFSCYFSDSLTASAAAKVICELKQDQQAAADDQFFEFSDVDEEGFEFSLDLSTEQVSGKQIDDLEHRQFIFPVFDGAVEEIEDASPASIRFKKSSVDEHEYSSSFSSSEADENECNCKPSGIFCMWRPKADVLSSVLAKCKKSSSTGSGSHGSRRWRIWNSLRRSNGEGEESMFFLRSKKTDASKERREVNTREGAKVAGKLKTTTSSPSFHELFYVQKRAEQKGDKMKSFLPYKQDLLGFFVTINRFGNKKLSF